MKIILVIFFVRILHCLGPFLCGIEGEWNEAFRKVVFVNIEPFRNNGGSDIIDNSNGESILAKCTEMHLLRKTNPIQWERIKTDCGLQGLSAARLNPGLNTSRTYVCDAMHSIYGLFNRHIFPFLSGKSCAFRIEIVNNRPKKVAVSNRFLSSDDLKELDAMYVL